MNHFVDVMAGAFQNELEKIAGNQLQKRAVASHPGLLPGMALGAGGLFLLSRANRDRALGRQMRKQQQQQGY